MIVEATTSARLLARAVAELGGTISWPEGVPPIGRAKVKAWVEPAVVNKDLGYDWYDEDDDDRADPTDVRDFVSACSSGDRLIAQALAPRLFSSPVNQQAFERGLFATPKAQRIAA